MLIFAITYFIFTFIFRRLSLLIFFFIDIDDIDIIFDYAAFIDISLFRRPMLPPLLPLFSPLSPCHYADACFDISSPFR
jgi:hypothetical protein